MVTARAPLNLVVALLACAVCTFAQSPSPKTKQDFSKEAAVFESYRSTYTFQNDGTGTQDVTANIKVQSEAGVRQYGVLVFSYPSASEHIEIDYVRVRQPDGTLVVTPPSNIEDATPQVTVAAPEYSDFREKHVAVKGLTPGSDVEYHVRFQTFSPLIPGQFWLSYDFTKNSIILDEELEVNVPQDRALKVKSSSIQPVVREQGDRKIYLWKSSNLEDLTLPQYPAGQYPLPDVLLSSFESWAQVGQWWASLADPQMAPTAAIRDKAAALTKGMTAEGQELQAIYGYVAKQFRYIGVSFGIGRYQPHAAEQVLANGYGDCKDKHTLLASLLDASGIKVFPALINSTREIDPNVPSPGQFDHVITVVPEGQKLDWMDATTELAPMGLLVFSLRNKHALIIPQKQPAYLAMTPAEPAVPDRVTFEADGDLTNDGTFNAKIKNVTDGDRALVMRLVFNNIAQANWQKAAQGFSELTGFGGTVSNVQVSPPDDTSHPFALSYDYVRKDYSSWSPESPHYITPPLPFGGVPALPHSDDKTPQPFVLGEPLDAKYRATIKLPAKWTVTLPKPLDLSTPFAEYHSAYSFKDGVLTAERRLITKADEVPVAQLDAYRKFQKAVSDDVQNQITLTGDSAASAANDNPADLLKRAETMSPDELNTAGMKLVDQGKNLSLARDLLLKATAKDPRNRWAWNNLGRAYAALGNNEEAIRAYKKQIDLNPKDQYAYTNLGRAYAALGKADDAIREYDKQIEVDPQGQSAYENLGYLYLKLGRFDDAVATYQKQIDTHPDDPRSYARLGVVLGAMQKWPDAVHAYERAAALDPKSWSYEFGLASSYAGEGKNDEAAAAFEKAAELNPSPRVWNDVGYTMADHDIKLSEAETFVKMATDSAENASKSVTLDKLEDANLGPTASLALYWDSLGWVYFREGDAQRARRFVEASWQLGQDSIVADHLGQIDEKLGQKQEAVKDYAWSVALSPGPPRPAAKGQVTTSAPPPRVPTANDRLMQLVGTTARLNAAVNKARDELSGMRTYWIRKAGTKTGTAEFFVLIRAGGKAEGVKFISGDDSLHSADKSIAAIKFNQSFPDDAPTKILRRGVLTCSKTDSSCNFVLLLPSTVRSIN
jgi:tetratricopeptide (TPR) repeat protein/transglutaminase-like putative cysteine protease